MISMVSHHVAGQADVAAHARAASTDPAKTGSFAALLDNSANASEPGHSFTFAELGMFGRHGSQSLPSEKTASGSPDRTKSQASAADAQSAGEPSLPSVKGVGETLLADTLYMPPDAGAQPEVQGAQSGANGNGLSPAASALFFASQDVASGATESTPVTEGGRIAPRFALPLPASREPNPVNLLVSGSDEALTIIARSSGESAEGAAKLRRLVEDAAAEFGMDIGEFQLNGSAAKQSFASAIGGNHGGRAR